MGTESGKYPLKVHFYFIVIFLVAVVFLLHQLPMSEILVRQMEISYKRIKPFSRYRADLYLDRHRPLTRSKMIGL